jgi:hypothetical protein
MNNLSCCLALSRAVSAFFSLLQAFQNVTHGNVKNMRFYFIKIPILGAIITVRLFDGITNGDA